MAMTPARQQEMAAMLARESAESKINWPAGFHAVQAKALMPEAGRANVVNTLKHHGPKNSAGIAAKQDSQQVASVETVGDQTIGAEQQWVVLTTWEEVRTVGRSSSTITDYYSSTVTTDATGDEAAQAQENDSKATGHATNGLQNRTSGRHAITQLILRLAPANSNSISTQPAMSVRSGWFVIQL
jgi:prophage DNA circulation protein